MVLAEHTKDVKPISNQYTSYSSSCRVVVFHYKEYNPNVSLGIDKILDSEVIVFDGNSDVNPVVSMSYRKTNNTPCGAFTLSLAPTEKWDRRIRPGDWMLIYLNNGRQTHDSLRCVGIVDSILEDEKIDPSTGARLVTYIVNGKDHGKIFERYNIWINPWVSDAIRQGELMWKLTGQIAGNPSFVADLFIRIFLGDNVLNEVAGMEDITKPLQQWYVPKGFASYLGTRGRGVSDPLGLGVYSESDEPKRFVHMMKRNIDKNLDGNYKIFDGDFFDTLWNVIHKYSNPNINEMFCEIDDSGWPDEIEYPAFYLRPIPFTFKNFSTPVSGVLRFLDLPSVEIGGSTIIGHSLGFNDTGRNNVFLLASTALDLETGVDPVPSITQLRMVDKGIPFLNSASCKRYGTSIYYRYTQYVQLGNNFNLSLLKNWNYLIKHWWENVPYFENGTITIAANPNVRLGKRLTVTDGPLLYNFKDGTVKSYYIEGYQDSWNYLGLWTQTVEVTRGVCVENGEEKYIHESYFGDVPVVGLTVIKRKP